MVIDLICYRRLGHNEADEPAATLPMLYQTIKSHPTTRTLYAQKLHDAQVVQPDESAALVKQVKAIMDDGGMLIKSVVDAKTKQQRFAVGAVHQPDWRQNVSTGVAIKRLKNAGALLANVPESLTCNAKLRRWSSNANRWPVVIFRSVGGWQNYSLTRPC